MICLLVFTIFFLGISNQPRKWKPIVLYEQPIELENQSLNSMVAFFGVLQTGQASRKALQTLQQERCLHGRNRKLELLEWQLLQTITPLPLIFISNSPQHSICFFSFSNVSSSPISSSFPLVLPQKDTASFGTTPKHAPLIPSPYPLAPQTFFWTNRGQSPWL